MLSHGKLRLGVNIDHVATVRNARGSAYPDPVRAAKLAEEAGADGSLRICGKTGAIFLTTILSALLMLCACP